LALADAGALSWQQLAADWDLSIYIYKFIKKEQHLFLIDSKFTPSNAFYREPFESVLSPSFDGLESLVKSQGVDTSVVPETTSHGAAGALAMSWEIHFIWLLFFWEILKTWKLE
jgi:hypothetical protein